MDSDSRPLSKSFGNLHCCCLISGEPIICVGPDWQYFACLFTFFLTIGLSLTVFVSTRISSNCVALTVGFFGFLLINYLLAATLNPGVETRKEPYLEDDEGIENFCGKCQVFRQDRTEHCDDCGVCIQEFDHHCPWTSKCIGKGNICFFYNFLIGILACFVFSLVLLAMMGQVGERNK